MIKKMKNILRKNLGLYQFLVNCSLFFSNLFYTFLGFLAFIKDYNKFAKIAKKNNIKITGIMPNFKDRYCSAGAIDPHYFFQDLYMAKKIINSNTKNHYDIGSRIDGFISHLLSSGKINITLLDIRPLELNVENLNFIQTDATNLKEIKDNSIDSISCLHAVEHFGLGRYGDPIDPFSCFKAIDSIQRVLAKNGVLYFSVPIANKDEIWFNCQRHFSPLTIIKLFNKLELIEFSIINNGHVTIYNGDLAVNKLNNNEIYVNQYDCGMFIFRKV